MNPIMKTRKTENVFISSKNIMPTKEILQSHPVSVLRKEISKTNIKGYSKMKKGEVIELMLKAENKEKFKHIKMAEKKQRVKAEPKGTHKMPDGTVMTGAVHSKNSKPVKAEPKKEEPKKEAPKKRTEASIEKDRVDFKRETDELSTKTFNIILKQDKDLLLKPSEFNDPKKMKQMKKLSKQLFETYKKSKMDLLDKYRFSKTRYREEALSEFRYFIRQAKKGKKQI